MVKDMTSGKPMKLILSFCVPLIIGNICQQMYNMVDSMVVGRGIGKDALAAVGSTGSLSFLIIGFILGVSSGFCIPVSQNFGAGDYRAMRHTIVNAVYLSGIITVVITALTMLVTPGLLHIMHTPENIYADAYSYIIIIFGGIFATMFYNLMSGILRAVGDSRSPLYFLIIAVFVNTVLDLLFVLVFKMGVAGAAVATVASQFIAGLLCLLYIIKKVPILLPKKEEIGDGLMRFEMPTARNLLFMGLPMGLQFSITAIGSLILQSAVNSLGSDAVAAVTSSYKIQNLVTQPMETLGITMATFCGQNLGAGKIDRIKHGVRQALAVMTGYCIAACAVMWLFGGNIAYLFIEPTEVDILSNIRLFLRINSSFYIPLGLIFLYRNSIQGIGYGVPAMAAGLFELVGRSAIALLLVPIYGFLAVCFASPAAWIAADILLLSVYYIKISSLTKKYEAIKKAEETL